MKKISLVVILIVIIVVIVIIATGKGPTTGVTDNGNSTSTMTVPVAETTKVSSRTSQYQNAELGFSVNYPTSWEADGSDTGVTFVMPIDNDQVSTIAKLQADISVANTKCAFPPIVTIKDRQTVTFGSNTLNMISMSNTTQGRSYSDKMYSLQKGSVCYTFKFSSIALSPQSKNLTGSNLIQAENNNKAIITAADAAFTEMVKSFQFVVGPSGQDETKAAPASKNPQTTSTSTKTTFTTKSTSTATTTR